MPDQQLLEIEASEIATALLSFFLLWLFAGFAAATMARVRRQRMVGRTLVVAEGDGRLRGFLLCLAVVGLVLGIGAEHGQEWPVVLFAFLLSVGILLQVPRAGEGCAGSEGLAVGWEAWTWPEVRSWRLLGRHLRVDVGERWLALPVSEAESRVLEELLVTRLPGRRSERA